MGAGLQNNYGESLIPNLNSVSIGLAADSRLPTDGQPEQWYSDLVTAGRSGVRIFGNKHIFPFPKTFIPAFGPTYPATECVLRVLFLG
jgi:hypothetical protein